MNKRLRTILIGAVGVIVVLLAGLFSGVLDGVLRQLNVQIAGHPAPAAEAVASSNVVAAPAKADAAPAVAASPAETIVPIFDLVRVEPTGDAVIAGRSDPDAKVEILSGKDVVADGKANDTGSWAIVLADPLKPGAHDLSVRVTDKDGKVASSEQSVAVSVPEGGNGDVLVVLNQPGSPSTVLQVPGLEEAQAKLADAGVDPAQATEAQQVAAAETPVAASATAVEPPTSASATATATAGNETTPATTAEPAAPITAEPAATPAAAPAATPATVEIPAPPADMLVAAATPALAPAAEAKPSEPATAQAAPQTAETPATAPADAGAAPAEVAPAAAPKAEPAAAPQAEPATTPKAEPVTTPQAEPAATPVPTVTIDAVELENGNSFYAAGSAANGAVIRLYVDDKAIGDTKAEKGRWLYQGKVELAPGKHLVRIDQVGANGAVIARAEVPFQIAEDGMSAPTLASGVGSAQAGAGSAGEAKPAEPETLIIRRGDNLWMIAKRLYGKGIRYSTIYQANTDQIRNPDLIYPGQVFVIPEGDAAWRPVGQ